MIIGFNLPGGAGLSCSKEKTTPEATLKESRCASPGFHPMSSRLPSLPNYQLLTQSLLGIPTAEAAFSYDLPAINHPPISIDGGMGLRHH